MAKKGRKLNTDEQLNVVAPSLDESEEFDIRKEMERHNNCDDPTIHEEYLKKNEAAVKEFSNRRGKKRKLSSIIFILANVLAIALTILMELSKEGGIPDLAGILPIWGENIRYIVFALLCMIGFYVLDSLKFFFMIRRTTKQWRLLLSVKVSVLGKYYDNITPLAAGGQPFQVYYLNKEGIPAGVAGAMPVVNFFFSQLAFVIIAVLLFSFNSSALMPGAAILAYIGAIISITVPLAVILFSIFPKTTWKLLKKVLNLLNRLRIIKDLPKAKKKVRSIIFDYARSLGLLTKSKLLILSNCVLSLLMQIVYCSVAFFVLRAFGDTTSKWLDVLTMCFAVYATISYVPTPGASGAAEISFGIIFAGLAAGVTAQFWGTLLWRGISYYLTLIFGLVVILINSFSSKKRTQRLTLQTNSAELAPIEASESADDTVNDQTTPTSDTLNDKND